MHHLMHGDTQHCQLYLMPYQKFDVFRKAKLDQELTLDLHGFHVDEALAALKQVLEDKEKGNLFACSLTPMNACQGCHFSRISLISGKSEVLFQGNSRSFSKKDM